MTPTIDDTAKFVEATEDEAKKLALEGEEIILSGAEVHARFVRHKGDPGIVVDYTPLFGNNDVPDWVTDISKRLGGVCQRTVMKMRDAERTRLLDLVERDGGTDRMLYRLFVTSRIADDGTHVNRVVDFIDPEFIGLDPGVLDRAMKARSEIEKVLEVKD